MTGLEPVRRSTHAPQTCLSTSSSTLALISRGEPLVSQRQDILYQGYPPLSTKFAKKFEKFSNAENYYQSRRKSTLFRTLSSAFGGMANCRPSGNSVGRQKFFYFFAEMLRKHLMRSAPIRPSLRMKRALKSGRWDSICCGKQPLNILEVVGLRAPTAVAECRRHSAKSRPSLRMKRALRSGRWDSISAEKPRRLKHATGMFLRAAFRIPPSEQKNNSHPNGWLLFWRRRWDSNSSNSFYLVIIRLLYRNYPKI